MKSEAIMMEWDWFNSLSASESSLPAQVHTTKHPKDHSQVFEVKGMQASGFFHHKVLNIWHFSEVTDVSEVTAGALHIAEQGGHHSTDTFYIIVINVSGNLQLINFKSYEVSLSCNWKTWKILSVPCTADVEPIKILYCRESTAFCLTHSLTFGLEKSTGGLWCITCITCMLYSTKCYVTLYKLNGI